MKKHIKARVFSLLILISWFCAYATPLTHAGPLDLQEIRMVADHSAVLADWLQKGIQEAVLVHVDAHGDLGPLPLYKAKQIEQLARFKDFRRLRQGDRPGHAGLYHCGNFLRAAISLRMFKSIRWVVPYDWFKAPKPGPDMIERLKAEGWSAKGLDTLVFQDGYFRGQEFGLEFLICDPTSLPSAAEPVVLSIDTDFIPAYAGLHRLSGLAGAEILARALLQKTDQILDISIAYSVNGDYTPALKGWLGEALRDLLLTQGRPVKKYLWDALQNADFLAENMASHDLLSFLESLPDPLRDDPYCLQYRADAYYLEDHIDGAFETASRACGSHKACCAVLSRIAYGLAIEGRAEQAERFLGELAKKNPEYQDWQADLETAMVWNEKGEYDKALFWLEKLSRQYCSYSAEFLIGGIYAKQNRFKQARVRFDRALSYLQAASFDETMRPEIAAAVSRAADFYDRRGLKTQSKAIRTHPRFEKIAADNGR